ncbi:MAG: lytic transglycosylase domain-containing protein, partial [Candidatus Firestonebacteria bacterium]|nr:lytic transglycosylase domain-containing protein [Candidatus Firestonebacteria bacterium]
YLNSIKELLNLGLYDEALTEIDKLRRIDYKDIDLLYIRILSSKENEQYHKAIESTEILIRLITDQDSRAYLKDESFLPKPLKEFSYPNYYSEYVEKYAQEYNVDPLFVYAIIKEESRFKLEARSYANAIGLMQIIPSTGRFIAQNMGQKKFSVEKLYEPETNIKMGIWYISYLLDKFEGNKFHTLAAYNGGPANVKRWLKRCSDKNDTDEFISIVSLDETHSYVKKVLASFNNYKDIYTLTNP